MSDKPELSRETIRLLMAARQVHQDMLGDLIRATEMKGSYSEKWTGAPRDDYKWKEGNRIAAEALERWYSALLSLGCQLVEDTNELSIDELQRLLDVGNIL